MNRFVRDNLEDYLAGTLGGARKEQWDAYLAGNPKAREEMASYEEGAHLLHELRLPETADAEPAPGFYARVMTRIEEERRTPFWMVFLQPSFVRQLGFASLMWLTLLGAYTVAFENTEVNRHVAESYLTEEPTAEYSVRLGTNLDQNRNSMLAVLMTSGD